jgi:hypothetical protein
MMVIGGLSISPRMGRARGLTVAWIAMLDACVHPLRSGPQFRHGA